MTTVPHQSQPLEAPSRRRPPPADSGQAVVEAAIVLPSMIFLILGILQLTMVQHARIMTEYAAFCAARAGIVYNADPTAMQRAAELALLPTMGRTDSLATYTQTAIRAIATETVERTPFQLPIVSVNVLRPLPSDLAGTITAHLGGQELDFDDVRDPAAKANILQIRVRYYYKMTVPFANQLLQTLFFAQVGGAYYIWQGAGLTQNNPMLEGGIDTNVAQATFLGAGQSLTPMAPNLVMAARLRRYYFPLQATYSMRMQSNIYLRNLGH